MEKKKPKNKIKIQGDDKLRVSMYAPKGMRISANSDDLLVSGVKQISSGGEIVQCANNKLEQIGNKMISESEGKIINKSFQDLVQFGNEMQAKTGGVIENLAASGVFETVALIGDRFGKQQEEFKKIMEAFVNSSGFRMAKETMDSFKKLESAIMLPSMDYVTLSLKF